jgi:predicted DNA-binding transcriptional regulator YafY
VLRVREGSGPRLRSSATAVGPDPDHPGWDLAELPFSDVGWFADLLASFGADVVALEPTDLREAVIRKLKGVLA